MEWLQSATSLSTAPLLYFALWLFLMLQGVKRIFVLQLNTFSRVLPKAFNKDTAVILAQAVNSSQAATYPHCATSHRNVSLSRLLQSLGRPKSGSFGALTAGWVRSITSCAILCRLVEVLHVTIFLWKVATKMDLVYLPSTGELRMWWVMST